MACRISGRKTILVSVSTWLLMGLSGCNYFYHPWYIVELDARRTTRTNASANVTIDPSAPIPNDIRIAILAPDDCEKRGGATSSGEATTNRVVIQVECGEILADVERAMVERGLPAISWKSIDQTVKSRHSMTAIEAASKLGATIILQINALENTNNSPTQLGERGITIRKSNHRGEYGPPVSVRTERSEALKKEMTPFLSPLGTGEQLGAFIDVTAILVPSGRSAWFYEWNHIEEVDDSEVSTSALFLCNRRIMSRCFLKRIKNRPDQNTWAPARQESTILLASPTTDQMAFAEAKRLLDETTDDMLNYLSKWLKQSSQPN